MEKHFEFESILASITKINYAENKEKILELARFVFNDMRINNENLSLLTVPLKEHLLSIHPSLNLIAKEKVGNEVNIEKWIASQKDVYGNSLPVSKLGEKLIIDQTTDLEKSDCEEINIENLVDNKDNLSFEEAKEVLEMRVFYKKLLKNYLDLGCEEQAKEISEIIDIVERMINDNIKQVKVKTRIK